MIKHIVCFKLKEGESPLKAKEVLLSMTGNVPTAKNIQVFIDELKSPRSYDVLLEVILDDFNALAVYQQDDYHCNVVKKYMHAVCASSVAMDFTL